MQISSPAHLVHIPAATVSNTRHYTLVMLHYQSTVRTLTLQSLGTWLACLQHWTLGRCWCRGTLCHRLLLLDGQSTILRTTSHGDTWTYLWELSSQKNQYITTMWQPRENNILTPFVSTGMSLHYARTVLQVPEHKECHPEKKRASEFNKPYT